MDVRVDAGEVLHGLPADRLDHSVVAEETAFAARAYSILELQDSVQLVLRARDENWAALARSLVLHRKSSVEGLLKRLLLD